MFDWLRKLWKISHVLFRSFCAQVRNLSIFERAAPVPRPRDVLLNSLRGSRVIVPDITRLLQHWPREINPSISLLEDSVNDKLERLFSGRRLKKMQAANAPLFAASWWPYADIYQLKIAAFLSIWLFAWDDELDSPEFSALANDFEKAQIFRRETVHFIRLCLAKPDEAARFTPSHYIIEDFREVGLAVGTAYDVDRRDTFLSELERFVQMTEIEHAFQMSDDLPTLEEYHWRRMGSSAVAVCLAITEFAFNIDLPQGARRHDDMLQIWQHTNIIISTVNDMLSIKKEIAQGQLDSLIPILYQRHGNIQTAMNVAFANIRDSVESFDAASSRLLQAFEHDRPTRVQIENFIDGCKYACTANLDWSLSSGRYLLNSPSLTGGLAIDL